MTTSLRRRLLGLIALLTCGAWGGAAVVQWHLLNQEVNDLFDAHVADASRTLYALVESELIEHGSGRKQSPEVAQLVARELEMKIPHTNYAQDHVYEVTLGDGALRVRSEGHPAASFGTARDNGFSTVDVAGTEWRVYALRGTGEPAPLSVVVAEPLSVRGAVLRGIALRVALPALLGVAAVVAVAWFALAWGLAPLARVTQEVERRDPNHLSPIAIVGRVAELIPLIDALNALLDRLAHALDAARHFTADAAHELRTPLAGIKTQAAVARGETDQTLRDHALAQIDAGINRLTHLVSNLLTLARLEPEIAEGEFRTLDLRALVAESLAALESVARAHAVRLNLIPEGIAPIHGHRETVALALRNVLENAILHGAHPGCVEVRGGRPSAGVDAHERAVDDDVTLHIDDDGPGIPPAERMIVLERFRRRPGMRVPGSGLGLSIAARCMQLHRGAIELGESPRGGLRVTLRFRATRRLATDADAHARNSR